MAVTFGGMIEAQTSKTLRWGIVGTGGIAHSMAPRIQQADNAELVAVSSRKMATAREFADSFGMQHAFDSWADMLAFDEVDAIYIATPTSVKEEISLAAARAGKHVLCEKPFADLPSVQRITSACRENGVGFMDGTHFPHHPRTAYIKAMMSEMVGQPVVGRIGLPVPVDRYRQYPHEPGPGALRGDRRYGLVQHAGGGGVPAGRC